MYNMCVWHKMIVTYNATSKNVVTKGTHTHTHTHTHKHTHTHTHTHTHKSSHPLIAGGSGFGQVMLPTDVPEQMVPPTVELVADW